MRIAISTAAGMCLAMTWVAVPALAQPAQPAPQPAPQPAQPVTPTPAGPSSSSALTPPESPPAPPPAGSGETATPKPPAAPPQSFSDETGMSWKPGGTQEPLAGWHGMFFVRDADENFRLSPHALLQLDFNGFVGPGVNGKSVSAPGGAGLPPRFFARRFRFGLVGEFLKRWSFKADIDFLPATDNAQGLDELFAAPVGVAPTGSSARYQPVQTASVSVRPADLYINYGLCPCLNFQIGQMRPPVSMENRSPDWQNTFMERSIAVRGFVVPAGRESGLMLWGDIGEKLFSYELMVDGGDGEDRFSIGTTADFAGRLMTRPFQGVKAIKDAHIGVSARHGERDPDAVGYNYPAITTGQGFILYNPSYTDSTGRKVKVIPSGAQNLIGGELRLPIGPLDIRGEAYYVANHTREAIDGYQFTNTERLGTLKGVAFYGQVTWWVLGDKFVSGDPGYIRPSKLNLKKKDEIKRGLEVAGLASGVIGDYVGSSRGGTPDANTPGATTNSASSFKTYQFALEASYWHSRWVRMTFNYAMYFTPSSGTTENSAVVPGNVYPTTPIASAHLLHELGLRLQLWN